MNNEDTIYDNVKTNRNDNEETQLGLNVKQTTEKNNGKKSDVKLEPGLNGLNPMARFVLWVLTL